jgi:DNA-binding NtrC family response regulator
MQVADIPRLRVLVVDDERLIRWCVAEELTRKGHVVLEAGNGAAAEKLLEKTADPIDALLLDCRLPDCNGLDLLRDLRRARPRSAAVMMTAYGSHEAREAAATLGVYRVLDKPFDLRILEPLLREAAERAATTAQR